MGLFDFFRRLFSGSKDKNIIEFYLRDEKCGEKIKVIFRKSYDIQRLYGDKEEAAYRIKKVVVCSNCYHKIKIEIKFGNNYDVLEKKIEGGKFITGEEYRD